MKTTNPKTKALSVLLVIVMILGMLPITASAGGSMDSAAVYTDAADIVDEAYGDFVISGAAEGISYADGVLTFTQGGDYTVALKSGITSTHDIIVVDAENVTLTLNNVTIYAPNGLPDPTPGKTALTLNHETSLILVGNNRLSGGDSGVDDDLDRSEAAGSGISGNVTISGTGNLTATGGDGMGALVPGRGANGISGSVTLSGGTITAIGGNGGSCGVGGADAGDGISGSVTLSGGTITAIGGNGGAGFIYGGDGWALRHDITAADGCVLNIKAGADEASAVAVDTYYREKFARIYGSALITGVSITIDDVAYTSSNTSAEKPAIISPQTESVIITVHGTNLQFSTEQKIRYGTSEGIMLTDSTWTFSEDGTTATYIVRPEEFTSFSSVYEIEYFNDDITPIGSGVYMFYDAEYGIVVIAGVTITIDGVEYTNSNTSAENPAIITPETKSIVLTVHGKYLQNGSQTNAIQYSASAANYISESTGWMFSEDGTTATRTVKSEEYISSLLAFELQYINLLVDMDMIGSGVYVRYDPLIPEEDMPVIAGVTITIDGVEYTSSNASAEKPAVVTPETESVIITVHGKNLHRSGGINMVVYSATFGSDISKKHGWTISEDGTTATLTIESDDFESNFYPIEIEYLNPHISRDMIGSGVFVYYDPLIPEEDMPVITGVSITIDDVAYTSSNISAEKPAVITPKTESVILAVHGKNLQNRTGQKIKFTANVFIMLNSSRWMISEDGTTATLSIPPIEFANSFSTYEILYFNDSITPINSGVFVIYCSNHTGGTVTCASGAICENCGAEYGELLDHILDSATGKCGVCENFAATASATIGGTTTYYEALDAAIQAVKDCTAADNATVTLLKNIDVGKDQFITSGVFTLDLNSFILDDGLDVDGGDVTITDSGTGGTITGACSVEIITGSLTINDGSLSGGSLGVRVNGGTVTIEKNAEITPGLLANAGTVFINGGTISGGYGVRNFGGTISITGGSISGTDIDLLLNRGTISLTLADGKTEGATFPDGLTAKFIPLKELLGQGLAYWQNGKQIAITDDQTQITGGDVTIRYCNHETNTNTVYTSNGDNTHSCECSDCGVAIIETHSLDSTTGKCGICETEVTASVTMNGITTYYETLDTAITAVKDCTAEDEAIVQLLAKVEKVKSYIRIDSGTFTLDLNGYELIGTSRGLAINGGDVTVIDSGRGGAIRGDGTLVSGDYGIDARNCRIIIESGIVSGERAGIRVSNSTAIINGGAFSGYRAVSASGGSNVTITGGQFSGSHSDLYRIDDANTITLTLAEGKDESGPFSNLEVEEITLKELLGQGLAYWQDGKMLLITDDQTSIRGTVVVKAACYHTENTNDYIFDDTTHSLTCSVCGIVLDSGAHTGSEATCEKKAYCTVCCNEYGEVDKTNHDSGIAYVNGICPNGCYETAVQNADGYYEVDNAGKLFWVAQQVNDRVNQSIKVKLTANIDLKNREWIPIGNNDSHYTGTFDGQDHAITGFRQTITSGGRWGLFHTSSSATIMNFSIDGEAVIDTADRIDYGVIGYAYKTTVTNVHSSVDLTAKQSAGSSIGGIVGNTSSGNSLTIDRCTFSGTLDMGGNDVDCLGGIVGYVYAGYTLNITNCGFYGTIISTSTTVDQIGGILGYYRGSGLTMKNCLSVGTISLTNNTFAGMLGGRALQIGGNIGNVANNYYSGSLPAFSDTEDESHGYWDQDMADYEAYGEGTAKLVTAEQLASGEVAYKLGEAWGQTINTHNYPIIGGATVYQIENCMGKAAYSNTNKNGHDYQNGNCTFCGEEMPAGVNSWNLSLYGDIRVNFLLKLDSTASTVEITVDDETFLFTTSDLSMEGNLYKATVGIAAAQMNQPITVMILEGEEITFTEAYTVRQYCDTVLADESNSQYHALIKEMLNYGAMAQVYFDYDVENLADNGITGVAAQDVPETTEELAVSGRTSGLHFYGASLVYRDRIAVRYYFTGDVTGCTFTANGNTYTPDTKDGMHYVEIADILPQDLDQQITLTVTDTEGNALTVTYSPMNYIVRMNAKDSDNLKALLKALYNYHLAAENLVAA